MFVCSYEEDYAKESTVPYMVVCKDYAKERTVPHMSVLSSSSMPGGDGSASKSAKARVRA